MGSNAASPTCGQRAALAPTELESRIPQRRERERVAGEQRDSESDARARREHVGARVVGEYVACRACAESEEAEGRDEREGEAAKFREGKGGPPD